MYILNIASAIKRCQSMSDESCQLKDFIFENYYKRIVFVKEKSYYSMKRFKKKICSCLQTN